MTPKIQNNSIYRSALVCTAATCLFTLVTTAFAATNDEGTYIDSVYNWGIWELGLEPASGPRVSANNAMNDRSRKLLFRPNDNASYIAQSIPVPPISTITPPPVPVAPPIPVIGLDGSGPVIPGNAPTAPNRRR